MKKKLAFALCAALMLCSMSVAALAAEPMTEADTLSTMISAADTLPGISAYPAEVRASEENGVYLLEKVYYLTAKDDPATIPIADFEREGRTYTLLDLLKNDQTETDTREHIEVVTLESKTKDMAEILKMLEPKLEVKTEDGYEGVLSLDHTTISVEAAEKPRRPRHVPRQGGRFRRMMLVMLITLGLLGGLAVATTANPRLLEVFWGKDFEPSAQASAYIAHDLAEMETNGYRVRVEEAVYDGMTLYVRYSIRDMSCDHLLGETNVDTGRRMLNEDEITAFDHAPVGWWTDNLWIDGQNVDMPGLSGGETWAGDENGEIVVSEMYRLDQVGVFLSGNVQIDLPIGEKQHYDYETWQSMLKEDGTFRKPDAGLVSFTLNCDAPVTHYADGERVILPDGTAAWVESADDTPVKLYVTVRFEISDAQREAFRAENGEGYVFPDGTVMPFDDVDMVGSWVYGLTLVDADGKPLRASLGYGEGNWGVGSGVADYVFSHEDAYPEQVYLAPQTGEDSADMAWAIPLPVRK